MEFPVCIKREKHVVTFKKSWKTDERRNGKLEPGEETGGGGVQPEKYEKKEKEVKKIKNPVARGRGEGAVMQLEISH